MIPISVVKSLELTLVERLTWEIKGDDNAIYTVFRKAVIDKSEKNVIPLIAELIRYLMEKNVNLR